MLDSFHLQLTPNPLLLDNMDIKQLKHEDGLSTRQLKYINIPSKY
jgi:hypothetical protein